MKLLPCRPETLKGTPAKGCDGGASLSDGSPYFIGRAPEDIARTPYRYRCFGCGHYTRLDVVAFNSLPDATLAQLDAAGMANKMLGPDVTPDQISDLISYGVELRLLAR